MNLPSSTARSGPGLQQQVLNILLARISSLNARSMLQKAIDRAGLPRETLGKEHVEALVAALSPGCRLFLGDDANVLLDAIAALAGDGAARATAHVDVVVEDDISTARRVAQVECVHAQASGFAGQRVVTMVSELARNIVSYSKGGFVEIATRPGAIVVVAKDNGPGIPDLELVLSGNYKSKTGLGKGILGVKRLSTRFDIQTDPSGTRIEAEVAL